MFTCTSCMHTCTNYKLRKPSLQETGALHYSFSSQCMASVIYSRPCISYSWCPTIRHFASSHLRRVRLSVREAHAPRGLMFGQIFMNCKWRIQYIFSSCTKCIQTGGHLTTGCSCHGTIGTMVNPPLHQRTIASGQRSSTSCMKLSETLFLVI